MYFISIYEHGIGLFLQCFFLYGEFALQKEADKGEQYQIRLSLFDIAYKQFFGKSWTGPLQHGKTVGEKVKLTYNQVCVFSLFHTILYVGLQICSYFTVMLE